MNKTVLIKLTELNKGGKTNDVLVNIEGIVLVGQNQLPSDEQFIVGISKMETVRQLSLTNGRTVFVTESMEEIVEKIEAASRLEAGTFSVVDGAAA